MINQRLGSACWIKPARSRVDWTNLPEELWDVILSKLVHLSDYIRFGAVCKSWRFVASNQKQKRIATMHKQPPMLLITTPQVFDHHHPWCYEFHPCKTYSFSEGKVYNAERYVPHMDFCLGSSYGWLAFSRHRRSIELINPFTRKRIEIQGGNWSSFDKVILSCDPTTCPTDFVLGAICSNTIAFMRASQNSWTFTRKRHMHTRIWDIIFYKGLLYGLEGNNRLIAVGYNCNPEDPEDQFAPVVEIVPECTNGYQFSPDFPFIQSDEHFTPGLSYLVEASNGDLLLVQRILDHVDEKLYFESNGRFRVYKLSKHKHEKKEEEELDWVEIRELENKDSIFLADNRQLCRSAVSCVPNCNQNSTIYFTHNFEDPRYCSIHRIPDKHIGVFGVEDGTVTELHGFRGDRNHTLPMVWITPTLR